MPKTTMEEDMQRMKDEFKKRVEESSARKTEEKKDEETKMIVQVAVRAGLLCIAGVSLCFSTFFIPGIVPFLGGLLCGVSLVEPPPLPGLVPRASTKYREQDLMSSSGGDNVIKQVLMNFIDHFF
jgi:hypothetical protein